MSAAQQVQEIEVNIEELKKVIDMNTALLRLEQNSDFIKVIRQGYLEKEAVRLVHLKAAPDFQRPERQADLIRAIDGIGALLGYFIQVQRMAEWAESALEENHEELADMAAEEGGV